MRRSTKRRIIKSLFGIAFIPFSSIILLNSGVLEIGAYSSLPEIGTENVYDVNTGKTNNAELDVILGKFKSDALAPDALVSELIIYDRQDSVVQTTTDLFCEIHTRTGSVEKENYYILTCKHTDETSWYLKNYQYDSQKEMKYYPYCSLLESEIKNSILGQKLSISGKNVELTEDNLIGLAILNQQIDYETYTEEADVELRISDALLEYTGRVQLNYTFMGSTWNLDSYTESEFASGYNEDIRPSFTGESYKKIIVENPYALPNGELTVTFKEDQIKNIEIIESSNNKNGNYYTERVSFDVMTDKALLSFTAECIYEYSAESDGDKWSLKEIEYTHNFEETSFEGYWAGRYIVIMPETEETPVKKKGAVLINFNIIGVNNRGEYYGSISWGEIKTDENGEEVAKNLQSTEFTASFDKDNLELFFIFMKPVKYVQQYANFALFYDFAQDSLKTGNYEFLRLRVDEVTGEEGDENEAEAEMEDESNIKDAKEDL